MKKAAIFMIVLVVVLAGGIVYGLFNTSLRVIGKGLQVMPAAERIEEFQQLQTAVKQRSLIGTILQSDDLTAAADYTYYSYTLRIKNPGLVSAEMVELQIAPISEDVLFYGESGEVVIGPGETRDVRCVLLARGTPHAVRDFYITYYLWGHPHEVKFTYDNTI